MKIPASVYMLTCNSELYLDKVLSSIRDFAEIIIVDSGSMDNTLNLCKKYECIIRSRDWMGYSKQKEYAKSLCSYNWVLDLDSDEEVNNDLLEDIRYLMEKEKHIYDGLRIHIHDIFFNRTKPGLVKTNNRIKFYRSDCGSYEIDRLVHESVKLRGKSRVAKGYIIHHGINSISARVEKSNLYSGLRAEEKYNKNIKPSLIKLILIFPIAFIKSYFIKRSIFAGRSGFIGSIITAFYAFLKEAKLHELKIK